MRQEPRIWPESSRSAPQVVEHCKTGGFVGPGAANTGKGLVWQGPGGDTAAGAAHLWGEVKQRFGFKSMVFLKF